MQWKMLVSSISYVGNCTMSYNHIHAVVCEYGDLRLVDGTTDLEGRVEICINETWGTVCDGGWSTFDAIVACRQLGYSPAGAVPLYNAAFGPGTGRIWIDDILCNSRESRLIDCPANSLGSHNCAHSEDAGVRCRNISLSMFMYSINWCHDHVIM